MKWTSSSGTARGGRNDLGFQDDDDYDNIPAYVAVPGLHGNANVKSDSDEEEKSDSDKNSSSSSKSSKWLLLFIIMLLYMLVRIPENHNLVYW